MINLKMTIFCIHILLFILILELAEIMSYQYIPNYSLY